MGNIAFIRDSDTLEMIGLAPFYDFGSSSHLENNKESLDCRINGMYFSESEALADIPEEYRNLIDLRRLPSLSEYRLLLDKCRYISEYRKQELLSQYMARQQVIKDMQEGLDAETAIKERI